MDKSLLPKTLKELGDMSDDDLEAARGHLAVEAESLRIYRQAIARECERRAALPPGQRTAHKITGAGDIESQES